jgi:HEAT repeat protein
MHDRYRALSAIVALLMILGCGVARAEDKRPVEKSAASDQAAIDRAFETLKTYDYGTDRNLLKPIDDAVIATHGDPAACLELEKRLAAVLSTDAERDAKEYVLRTLRIIGTAESVPAIAPLLEDKNLSHMARYALELNPSPEAGNALRSALPKVGGKLKIGMIGSLASRHDTESVAAIAASLTDSDKAISRTAAHALGAIGDSEAAKQLGDFLPKAPDDVKPAATDAYLVCAEKLLKHGKKSEAIAIYKSLMGENEPKPIRIAATHGLLVASGKKD